jgi:hypothetical protein
MQRRFKEFTSLVIETPAAHAVSKSAIYKTIAETKWWVTSLGLTKQQ